MIPLLHTLSDEVRPPEGHVLRDARRVYRNRYRDFEKLKKMGVKAYQAEQSEKAAILNELLVNYNDGRKKTLFCLAVNLLELDDLRKVMEQIKEDEESLSIKEKAARMAGLLQEAAAQKGISLKLRKKPPVKGKEM